MTNRPLRRLALALSIAAMGAPARSHAAPAAAPAADSFVQMDHISVQVIGQGSPVILIPGLASPRAVWDGVAPDLARTHRVYLVQVNGFGGDDPRANRQPGLLGGIVADLHRLIETRKLKGPAVIGHSLGGLATLMLAARHPDDVGRALIVDALPFIGRLFAPAATVAAIEPQAALMRLQMAGLQGKPVPDAVAQSIARSNALLPESRRRIAAWVAAADMGVAGQALYEDMQTDLRPELPRIAAPVTVLVPWTDARGGEAPALARYRGDYAGTPRLTLRGVGESGHFIMLDQPDAFARAVAEFLQ